MDRGPPGRGSVLDQPTRRPIVIAQLGELAQLVIQGARGQRHALRFPVGLQVAPVVGVDPERARPRSAASRTWG